MKIIKQNDTYIPLDFGLYLYIVEGENSMTGHFIFHFFTNKFISDNETLKVAKKHLKDNSCGGDDTIGLIYCLVNGVATYKIED